MSTHYNMPSLAVSSDSLKETKLGERVVTGVNCSAFALSVENALEGLSSAIESKTIALDDELSLKSENGVKNRVIKKAIDDLGISADPEKSISVDIDRFVDISHTEPSWVYMCKADVNVYLQQYGNNYGDTLAIPTKGVRFRSAPDFQYNDEGKHLTIVSSFSGEYTYFDETCRERVSSCADTFVLVDVRDRACPYKWCAVYRCERRLRPDDVLSSLDIKYVAQSDRGSRVINAREEDVFTMDFCFSDEPFVINKDFDYVFAIHYKHEPDLSAHPIFSENAMSSVTYFRCRQFVLKNPGADGAGNTVDHGNVWIGWNAVSELSGGLGGKNMDWAWHSQSSSNQENAHKFVGPMDFVQDKDGYKVLGETVITKIIADSIYANKTEYVYDDEYKLLGKLRINRYSSESSYDSRVEEQSPDELYIIDQTDGFNVYGSVVKNVADGVEESDAANVGTARRLVRSLSALSQGLDDVDYSRIEDVTVALSTLIRRIKNIGEIV